VSDFFVVEVVKKGQYGDTIVHVEGKAESAVVNDGHVFHFPVRYNSQILDQSELSIDAMLSVESCGEYLIIGVQIVEDCVGIELVACCECDDLIGILKTLEAPAQSRSFVNVNVNFVGCF
jgi:hypothetical protein